MVAFDNSVSPATSTTTRYYGACPERSRENNQRVLLETDYNAATETETDVRYFVYGNYIDEVLVMVDVSLSRDYYYAHDHLYSPVLVYGPTGGVQWGERYEGACPERSRRNAYGKTAVMAATDYSPRSSSSIGNPYTFTGRRLDAMDDGDLNLMYYRARTYDPETGRFMQRDILSYIDSMNTYEYTMSNPLNYFDALGLWSADDHDPRDMEISETREDENGRYTVSFSSIRSLFSVELELFGDWGNWKVKKDSLVGSYKFRNGLRREWREGSGCVFVYYEGTATAYLRYRERINTLIAMSLRIDRDWGDQTTKRLLDLMSNAPLISVIATIESAIIDETGTPNSKPNWDIHRSEKTETESESFWEYKNFTDSKIINKDPHKQKCECETKWIGTPTIRLFNGKDYPLNFLENPK